MRQAGLEAAPLRASPVRPWETSPLAFNWARLVKVLALETFQLQVLGAVRDSATWRVLCPLRMPAGNGSHNQGSSAMFQAP